MICRIADLQYKEVIDIADGTRYGFVGDVELDPERGAVAGLVVRGRPRLFGLLGRAEDAVFPWSCVKRFGEDIILVDGRTGGGQGPRRR
ncbi:MAG: YlmC/YmxH family sporulation protein [Clostridiales bacterium]|nr:YlmC/YmxH family sporulation protein [Clostridiales bacterium]